MELIEIDKNNRKAIFKDLVNNKNISKDFDAMHFTPHMGPNKFLKDAKITNELGYVEVDIQTL